MTSPTHIHKPTILVTGANGLIGRWLVPALLNQGYRVLAAMRQPEQREQAYRAFVERRLEHPNQTRPQLQLVAFSLQEPERLFKDQPELCLPIQAVFHLAAAFAWDLKQADTHQVNVDASLQLLEQIAHLPQLKRFIWIGGYRVAGKPDLDDAALYKKLGAYEASKLIAYERMKEQASELGIPWTALNPSSVIGDSISGDTTQFIGIAEIVQQLQHKKLAMIPGNRDTFVPLVHVDFVAEFCARLLEYDDSINQEYWLLDDTTPNLDALLQRFAQQLGVKAPRSHIPVWILERLPSFLLPGSRETLSFLSTDRYDISNTKALAQRMGIAHLLPLNNVEGWVDSLVSQGFGAAGIAGVHLGSQLSVK